LHIIKILLHTISNDLNNQNNQKRIMVAVNCSHLVILLLLIVLSLLLRCCCLGICGFC